MYVINDSHSHQWLLQCHYSWQFTNWIGAFAISIPFAAYCYSQIPLQEIITPMQFKNTTTYDILHGYVARGKYTTRKHLKRSRTYSFHKEHRKMAEWIIATVPCVLKFSFSSFHIIVTRTGSNLVLVIPTMLKNWTLKTVHYEQPSAK